MTRKTITATMPGVFYRRPDPEEEEYVQEGDHVEEGDVVGLIGVMKNFQEVEADVAGTVVELIAENEQEIEAGDELVAVETG